MAVKIGINGLGRIGRMVVRSIVESKNKNIEIKHINNRTSSENSSQLLKYDSIHGKFNADISFNEKNLILDKYEKITIKFCFEKTTFLTILVHFTKNRTGFFIPRNLSKFIYC